MQEQIGQTKFQKWMKNASQQKMNKITENKKYTKEIEKKTFMNGEEFMIELDLIDQKQEKQVPKVQEKNQESIFFLDLLRDAHKQKQFHHKFSFQEQEQQCEEEVNKEEQKFEKENQIKNDCWKRKKDCQDLSNIQKSSKVMIIQVDSDEKYTENTNTVISTKINGQQNQTIQVSKEQKEGQNDKTNQEKLGQKLESQRQQYESQLLKINQQKHPKIQIQQNVNPKQHKKKPVMIVDAFMQTDDTSDIYGQEILNLILLEQNTVYQLNQLHEKILRLLNNQI